MSNSLSLDEVIDAITITDSSQRDDPVFSNFIRALFHPIVEISHEPRDRSTVCRLFHSTIKEFPPKNCSIFKDTSRDEEKIYPISGETIAHACLAYLRQSK